jgi:hypothetical protein
MKFVILGLCGGFALAGVGCSDGRGVPTAPSATAALSVAQEGASALSASHRSGDLHVKKECVAPDFTGNAGDFCTITASDLRAIEPGSRVIYAVGITSASLDTDVVLDTPGPGNNKAFGHCTLDVATGLGVCWFAGGTGKFTHFRASVQVTPPGADGYWHWDGTYSFSPGQ